MGMVRTGILLAATWMAAFTLGACGGGGGEAAPVNTAPVANAGLDQAVDTGSLVTLTGAGSSDADGDTLTYAWTLTSRPASSAAALASAATVTPTFTADVEGDYVVELVVNDGTASSAADAVTVTATTPNTPPVANAGPDQAVDTGALVTLTGAGSSDLDGDTLTHAWTITSKPPGSAAVLTGAATVAPTFTADLEGAYVVRLVVNDGAASSAPDTVNVTATTPNYAPVANAGLDRNVVTGAAVTLSGSGSDANGDPMTYAWSFTVKPEGSAATLSDPSVANPSFTTDLDGPYVLSLVVSDGALAGAPDLVTLSAAPQALTSNGDGTVSDGLTGLMWPQADSWSLDNWYVASGTYHATYNPSTTSRCAERTTGGHVDWRLPTWPEIFTTVDPRRDNPAFDPTYFPMTGYDRLYLSFFWTATVSAPGWAYKLSPSASLDTVSMTDNQSRHYIRCVRGPALAGPSYTNNGDGTVTDATSGFTWQRCSAGKTIDATCSGTASILGWQAAVSYCAGLSLGGQTDWRLPGVQELVSIVGDTSAFPGTISAHYWTATTVAGTASAASAWTMDFQYRRPSVDDKEGGLFDGNYVRCVR